MFISEILNFFLNFSFRIDRYEKYKTILYEGRLTSLVEYPKTENKEIKTFNDVVCSGFQLCVSSLDEKNLVVIGKCFYIIDLEKLELIKTIEYGHSIDSIIKFGKENSYSYLIGVTINEEKEDIYQLQQVIYNNESQNFIKIANQSIHYRNIISILLLNDSIITGSCDKIIKILK